MSSPKPYLYIKPVKGLVIRNPLTGAPIGEDGAKVPNNALYQGYLKDGEAVEVKAPVKTKALAKTRAPAKPAENKE